MTRKYLLGLGLLAAVFLYSCEDDLNTAPEGDIMTEEQKEEVYANQEEKRIAAVNAIFAQLNQYMPNEDALGAARDNDFGYPSIMMFTDANSADVVSEDNGYNWAGNNLDFSDRVYTSNESQILWNNMYAIIRVSNTLIESIDPDTENPDFQFNLAQGLSGRAFAYWVLANLYQFNYVGNESAPCVPIITEANAEEAAWEGVPRSTVQQVYDLILSDLNSAINLMTSSEGERSDKRYFDLSVAYGLRARAHLSMQKWPEAAADAESAIEASDAEPASIEDLSKPTFWNAENEDNWMWGIILSETDRVVTSGIVNWLSHMGSLNFGYANFSKGKQINKGLYYSIPASDVRKGWWLDEDKTSPNLNAEQTAFVQRYPPYTHVKFAPYNNVIGNSVNSSDIPLMRIEEMYLILAEAQAMQAPATGLKTLVDFVKEYRDLDYAFAGASATEIQEEVYRQRRIELWGEGLIWFDVMRLGKGVDRRGGGYPNATMIFNIAGNDPVLLWRIPEAEIQANM
ncbi:MAG: RagB/SusD family nutrient uptake outer membrane protein, partial [Bacteroidales bacterium]|nr:RagB/SusD family nutrient uptake outer membrane protein [Bacteroidales bacterium]